MVILHVAPLLVPIVDTQGRVIQPRNRQRPHTYRQNFFPMARDSVTHCGGVTPLVNSHGVRKTHELTMLANSILNAIMPPPVPEDLEPTAIKTQRLQHECSNLGVWISQLHSETNEIRRRQATTLQVKSGVTP